MLFNLLIATATATTELVEKVVEAPAAKAAIKETSIFSHVMDSDPLVKGTLLILAFFSIACWAVIFYKISQLKKAQKYSQSFWQKFSATPKISDMISIKSLRQGPMYEIFSCGQQTLEKIKKNATKIAPHHRQILVQRINQSKEEEVYKLEQYVSFLATTASAAPFIGLFGTVWGILMAFMAIGKAGSTSLATVGPYIAEALVATAVGLFAAIPAVIAYNYFVNKIKIINTMIDLFIDDFMLKSDQELA
jgi:biopolymer transport protein TolQ